MIDKFLEEFRIDLNKQSHEFHQVYLIKKFTNFEIRFF